MKAATCALRTVLTVEAAAATAVAAAKSAAATASVATAEAATAAAAWTLHHQVDAGACGVRLTAAGAARWARRGAIQLGAQVRVGAWLTVVKAVVVMVERLARCAGLTLLTGFTQFAWLARLAWLTRCLVTLAVAADWGVGAAWVIARRTLARTVKPLTAAAGLAVCVCALLTFRTLATFALSKVTRLHA